ncbi:MAG: DUF4382 domain-containing protein [Pseudomonadales bacterium]
MTFRLKAGWLLAALVMLFLGGCGGGGGGSDGPLAAAPAPVAQAPADQTGVVGILIKDAPAPDFTRIIMVVSRVALIPEDGDRQVILLDEPKEFDLLELQNFYDMLAVSENVPVGDYEKIRLIVDSITVCYLNDMDAEVCEDAVVPANGKVDLNPRGSFTVAADTAILIEVDIDAKKSFHVVGTGNGTIRFRPVVFVDIQQRQALQGLLRASGTVGDIDTGTSSFDLCDIETRLDTDTNGCLKVNTSEDTSLFNAAGQPVDFANLVTGEPVTVYGIAVVIRDAHDGDSDSDSDDSDSDGDSDTDSDTDSDSDSDMDSDGDSDGDSDSDSDRNDTVRMVQLDAIVVQKGLPEDILSLSGTALTPVDEDGVFSLDLADGEELDVEQIDVLVQSGTKILSAADLSELDASAIDTGVVAEVNGVIPDESPGVLHASLILIAPPEESRDQLTGEVTSIDTETFTLFVDDTEPAGDRCIRPTVDAHFITVTELLEGGFGVTESGFADLEVGQQATVIGDDSGSCFEADDVIIQLVEEETPPS